MSTGHADARPARRSVLRRPAARALLVGGAVVLTAALALTGYSGASAAFTTTTASPGNSWTTKTSFPTYRAAVTDSGPVIHHPFDDAYGSVAAADLYGVNGTYNGATALAASGTTAISSTGGGPRAAVELSEGGYAETNSTVPIPGSPVRLTMEAWVRTVHGGAVVSLLPAAAGSPATAGTVQLYVNADGQACVGLTLVSQTPQKVCGSDPEDVKVFTGATALWRHVVAVIDPSRPSADGDQITVYVDGVEVYDEALGGTWPSTFNGRVRVGSAPVAVGPAPSTWSGDIDEVAIYPSALSADTVATHYKVAKGTVSVTGGYTQSVNDSGPQLYWRLDTSPTPGGSVTGATNAHPGTFYSYPGLRAAGAPTGVTPTSSGTGVGLSGINDISTGASRRTPAAFSTEVWFRSTGGTGPLVSFVPDGSSGPDRAVYLTAGGDLAFRMVSPARTLLAGGTYLDGKWHLVTVTMSGTGRMSLYVDGVLAVDSSAAAAGLSSPGRWRWGGGGSYSSASYPTQPGAPFFTGVLDEASVYDKELTAEDVAVHWGARL